MVILAVATPLLLLLLLLAWWWWWCRCISSADGDVGAVPLSSSASCALWEWIRRSMSEMRSPARSASVDTTVGGSWAGSPTRTSRSTRHKLSGMMASGSVHCDASSTMHA